MLQTLLNVMLTLSAMCLPQDTVNVEGKIENPIRQFGKSVDYHLVADTEFGWQTGELAADIDLNGYRLTIDTGGGNRTDLVGSISGKGDLVWIGGGNAGWQTTPSYLGGDQANSFQGKLTIQQGMLALAKPNGMAAFTGDCLVLGGGSNQAIVRLDADEQIGDVTNIKIVGPHEGRIWVHGHRETLGRLEVQTYAYVDLGDGRSEIAFADSRDAPWDFDKTLTIRNWTADHDVIRFGNDRQGLSKDQIARIGFEDPSGLPMGLYSARMTPDGHLVPNDLVVAVDPPFDVSASARAARRTLYEIDGLGHLSGENTPLRDGMTISFFGDSITWQDNFIKLIRESLRKGPATKHLTVQLVNHGINGGGVLSVRDGTDKAAFVDSENRDGAQKTFAEVIRSDHSDVAVVFIGINDVWWRETSPEQFKAALLDLVKAARANRTKLVLATLAVYQEKPDGTNPLDAKCDRYAQITRDVADETSTTLVDLRRAWLAYLQNHNAELRVDGTLKFVQQGILTYDGVHPTALGNSIIADHLSHGIVEALRQAAASEL